MEMDFAERLKGFDAVWRRVQKSRGPATQGRCPNCRKPQRSKTPGSRAKRFSP